jgi:pantetheine-phosphate adenylyltransferase
VRIIAGERRGATIAAPPGLATRPTGDRVREAAFNLIGPVDGATVLDLFAGSGALGLEALSRGAASATFVESDRAACRVISDNLAKLRLTGARVVCADAVWTLRQEPRTYDLVLVDPPYEQWEALEPKLAQPLARVLDRGAHDAGAPARAPHLAAVRFRAAHPLRASIVITAIYPGTYDPVTLGHVDVIERAAAIFDRIVVGVVGNPRHKQPMFSLDERVEFLREALADLSNVEVDVFSELVVDFARRWDAKVIVKGLRVISDFEWEFQMNQLNRHLAPEIETVYVMASPQVSFVSSSGVKEIAAFGGKVDELVPDTVARRLAEKFPNGRPGAPENPRE